VSEFLPCTVPGCELRSSEPPFRHEGNVLCPQHAVMRAGALCADCGSVFTYSSTFAGHLNAYAGPDGRALCIDCWANAGSA
jgi:hypothetical protein